MTRSTLRIGRTFSGKTKVGKVRNAPVAGAIYCSSSEGDDGNNGLTTDTPVATLRRASNLGESVGSGPVTILLKAGDTWLVDEGDIPLNRAQGEPKETAQSDGSGKIIFHWRVNRALTLTTYGGSDRANIVGLESYTQEDHPEHGLILSANAQVAIAITRPCTSVAVNVSNIRVSNFQIGAFHIYGSNDVTVENCVFDSIGTLFYPGEENPDIYASGAFYPKYAARIICRDCTFSNIHNERGGNREDDLHVFYMQKCNNITIEDCLIEDASSGGVIKFDDESHTAWVTGNTVNRGGLSVEEGGAQYGFIRITAGGSEDSGTPHTIEFTNNTFSKLYCIAAETAGSCSGQTGEKWSGEYFDDFEATAGDCWDDDVVVKTNDCATNSRGITFTGNTWDPTF